MSIFVRFSLLMLLLVFSTSFSEIDAALSCYTCDPCETPWNPMKASITRTSGPNDFCRKIVTGNKVVKDFSSTCTSANAMGNGVFCCQLDFCNSAHRFSMINTLLIFAVVFAVFYRRD